MANVVMVATVASSVWGVCESKAVWEVVGGRNLQGSLARPETEVAKKSTEARVAKVVVNRMLLIER
jgi:hypothetical protein